jgi:hypothetical protein
MMQERVGKLISRSATHRGLLASLEEGKALYEEFLKGSDSGLPAWAMNMSGDIEADKAKQRLFKNYETYAGKLEKSEMLRKNPGGKINARMGYREPKFPLLMSMEGRELEPMGSGFKVGPAKGLSAFDDSIDASLERAIATISGIRTVEKEAAQTSANLAGGAMKKSSGKMMGHASQASRAVAAGTKGSKNLRFSSAAAKLFKARF